MIGFKIIDCSRWEKSRILYSRSNDYATRQVFRATTKVACIAGVFWVGETLFVFVMLL